jgi:hypothetical protein
MKYVIKFCSYKDYQLFPVYIISSLFLTLANHLKVIIKARELNIERVVDVALFYSPVHFDQLYYVSVASSV